MFIGEMRRPQWWTFDIAAVAPGEVLCERFQTRFAALAG
jgi:hypothetical protein